MEVLDGAGVEKVKPQELLECTFDHAVYAQLEVDDYNVHKSGKPLEFEDFFSHPDDYLADFYKYTRVADLLIAAAYWDPKAPVLFTREQAIENDFNLPTVLPNERPLSIIDKRI